MEGREVSGILVTFLFFAACIRASSAIADLNFVHSGDQFESTKSSTPKPRFGTSNREAGEKQYISAEHEKSGFGRMSPGPSAYNLSGGLGKQTRSDRTSLPSWRLGTEKRFSDYAARESANAPGPGKHFLNPELTCTWVLMQMTHSQLSLQSHLIRS